MPTQDTNKIKEKIISVLGLDGPSLPVHIAKKIEQSILFTSAFLSELVSEKRVKMSNMRVGSSPIYFLEGQEPMLEKFSHYLKSKEREAFSLLKEKKFLDDSNQEPAIRVALREIKDFAIPFNVGEKVFWRFFSVPESEFQKQTEQLEKSLIVEEGLKEKREGPILLEKPIKKIRKSQKKSRTVKKEEKFLDKIRNFLNERSIEIIDILNIEKSEIILKIREKNKEEKLIIAYNKKKVSEVDIIKASKKASEFNLPYIVVSTGEPLKKITEFIIASKNLQSLEKLK